MILKKRIYPAIAGIALLGGGALRGQETAPPLPQLPDDAGPVVIRDAGGPGPGPMISERVQILGFEGLHDNKVVKGAPFSAVAVSESTQTLADGNHIVRKTQTTLYRDSEGRVRREVTLPALGPLAASGQPHSFVVIHDPVAGTAYVLEADQKIARKLPVPPQGGPGEVAFGGNVAYHRTGGPGGAGPQVSTESLGTEDVGGVIATGTRYTWTIPAGQIGNEKPIITVNEVWNSTDLQMAVSSKRTDPRFGDTTYTLTNIQRTEPNASLFQVPPGYTVTEGPMRKQVFFNGAAGAPPPPLPNE